MESLLILWEERTASGTVDLSPSWWKSAEDHHHLIVVKSAKTKVSEEEAEASANDLADEITSMEQVKADPPPIVSFGNEH